MVHGALLTIQLSDVELEAGPRDEADWDEARVAAREAEAKQAELAAAELAKLSKHSGWAGGYLMQQLVNYLLNSLQLVITNLHISLNNCSSSSDGDGDAGRGDDSACRVGLRVARLATTLDPQAGLHSAVYRMLQRTHVVRADSGERGGGG